MNPKDQAGQGGVKEQRHPRGDQEGQAEQYEEDDDAEEASRDGSHDGADEEDEENHERPRRVPHPTRAPSEQPQLAQNLCGASLAAGPPVRHASANGLPAVHASDVRPGDPPRHSVASSAPASEARRSTGSDGQGGGAGAKGSSVGIGSMPWGHKAKSAQSNPDQENAGHSLEDPDGVLAPGLVYATKAARQRDGMESST